MTYEDDWAKSHDQRNFMCDSLALEVGNSQYVDDGWQNIDVNLTENSTFKIENEKTHLSPKLSAPNKQRKKKTIDTIE